MLKHILTLFCGIRVIGCSRLKCVYVCVRTCAYARARVCERQSCIFRSLWPLCNQDMHKTILEHSYVHVTSAENRISTLLVIIELHKTCKQNCCMYLPNGTGV